MSGLPWVDSSRDCQGLAKQPPCGNYTQTVEMARKVSSKAIPDNLQGSSVGCAECHTLRPGAHADTFEHNGYDIHVVVSPKDCATCHSSEAAQYSKNIMAHAYDNLDANRLYRKLQLSINGRKEFKAGKITFLPADDDTKAETCYYCHGTKLEVTGTEIRDTELAGELEFPVISGWPNQGVGRVNLDGSLGSCAACHTRHAFSIEMARKAPRVFD
jgi:cytochrome c553